MEVGAYFLLTMGKEMNDFSPDRPSLFRPTYRSASLTPAPFVRFAGAYPLSAEPGNRRDAGWRNSRDGPLVQWRPAVARSRADRCPRSRRLSPRRCV